MIKSIHLNNIFLYITENCNLECDYCYFKDKRARNLDLATIKKFIDFLRDNLPSEPKTFIISGGEPLLQWQLTTQTINYIRKKYANIPINIQTNGLILNKNKISFIKDKGVNLEIGIDGNFNDVKSHRKGTTQTHFNNLIAGIQLGLRKGIKISCNMTVHPKEANKLYDNFQFLLSVGMKSVDITPAALINWTNNKIRIFKKQYIKIVKEHYEKLYTKEDLTFLPSYSLDLSLHPYNYVLCGDPYLCLPEEDRKNYSLFSFDRQATVKKSRLFFYLARYRSLFNEVGNKITYHDYVSASFKIVESITNKSFEQTVKFHNFQKAAHLLKLVK